MKEETKRITKIEDDPKIKQAWDEAKEAIKKAQQEFAQSIKAIKDSHNNREKDYVEQKRYQSLVPMSSPFSS